MFPVSVERSVNYRDLNLLNYLFPVIVLSVAPEQKLFTAIWYFPDSVERFRSRDSNSLITHCLFCLFWAPEQKLFTAILCFLTLSSVLLARDSNLVNYSFPGFVLFVAPWQKLFTVCWLQILGYVILFAFWQFILLSTLAEVAFCAAFYCFPDYLVQGLVFFANLLVFVFV